ncbi:MAG: DUF1631 family protein [Spongiibacteraceae bacterium]
MELLQYCQGHAHTFYRDLLLAAEKTLANVLFEHASAAVNNEEQRHFYEAMQQLKNRSNIMHSVFADELNKALDYYKKNEPEAPPINEKIDPKTLTLVPPDDLENELAISVIVSKANSRNSESLWKLNRRLAVLRGGNAVNDETNPFAPAMVCAALHQATLQLGVSGKPQILIYKQLGKVFVISFAKELDALNALLAEKGILPNLRFSISTKPAPSKQLENARDGSPPQTEAQTDPGGLVLDSASSIAHQQKLYSAIRNLQLAQSTRTETASGVSFRGISTDGTGTDSFSAMDYALALTAIQQSRAILSAANMNRPLDIAKIEERLFSHLAKHSNELARHKMTTDDANTVDLVGMIFRYMLDDPDLHDTVKSLLSHLHTPYLKLALIDNTFLDDYQHSARLLLNNMADLGSKWVKNSNDRNVLPKIKSTVEHILQSFVEDTSLFDELLDDISRFKEHIEKRSRMVEKRNTESLLGQEKLELSRQQATNAVNQRLEQAHINDKVADLLRKPWADFLAFNLLRHGEESLTWQSALKVVDGVVWSVRPTTVANNRDNFQRHQTDLELSVSEGLSTIGYAQDAAKDLLTSLKAAQELAYHNLGMKVHESQNNVELSATSIRQQKTLKPQPITLSPEEAKIANILKDIAFGTWFEFDQDQASVALKLAWFSRITSHYMFVDQAGVKQTVETQINLIKGICAGRIRIAKLSKKTFMERALEAVLERLKLAR